MTSAERENTAPSRGATFQVQARCPVCGDEMHVVRLECDTCGSALEGRFSLGRFQRLNRDQLLFAETFLKARGKIKDVEEELGISYPTVVSRLNEVVQAMGFPVEKDEPDAGTRRQEILDRLAAGSISATEAAAQLRNLS